MNPFVILVLLLTVLISACEPKVIRTEEGIASYYANFFQGQITASGEPYDSLSMTAAHRSLPFGTVVVVTNLSNQKKVEVTINDRGPFVERRIIDLSKAAAKKLDFIERGIIKVRLEIMERTGPANSR